MTEQAHRKWILRKEAYW